MKKSTWGRELGDRVQQAYALWRSRHVGVKSVLHMDASKDAGMWTAIVRIFPKEKNVDWRLGGTSTVHGPVGRSNLQDPTPRELEGWSAPDFQVYKSDWAPTKEDCLRRAVEDFEYECANL